MKLSPPPTLISTPPFPKKTIQVTSIPAIKKYQVNSGNPITHSEDRMSRLELIRQRRSRENVHSIEETVVRKEQSDDTFQYGIKQPTMVVRVDNVRY